MLKNIGKFPLIGSVVIILGFGTLLSYQYLQGKNDPRQRDRELIEAWEKAYREDPYGGITPEETLQLFIDALKKGDTDLATKYFILDEQEEWKKNLERVENEGHLDEMITDLERAERGNNLTEESTRFVVTNEKKQVITIINIGKSLNGKWKIVDM